MKPTPKFQANFVHVPDRALVRRADVLAGVVHPTISKWLKSNGFAENKTSPQILIPEYSLDDTSEKKSKRSKASASSDQATPELSPLPLTASENK